MAFLARGCRLRAHLSGSASMYRVPASLGLFVLLLGCPEVSPTNPFDPATPVSQQGTSVVRGVAWLPPAVTLAGIPADAVVELVPFAADEAVASVALVLDAEAEPEGAPGMAQKPEARVLLEPTGGNRT
jgi:hypothetical protein